MKSRGERPRAWGEGWLIAAALCLAGALCLFLYMASRPEARAILPLHTVPYAQLVRAERTDINHATAEEIAALPGIGDVLARRIVDFRDTHGPFASREALLQVEGIGEGKLNGIRDLIYVETDAVSAG